MHFFADYHRFLDYYLYCPFTWYYFYCIISGILQRSPILRFLCPPYDRLQSARAYRNYPDVETKEARFLSLFRCSIPALQLPPARFRNRTF